MGTETCGTGIGQGTMGLVAQEAVLAEIGGGGGVGNAGDPTWTAALVAVAASYSYTAETVGTHTRPFGSTFYTSLGVFWSFIIGIGMTQDQKGFAGVVSGGDEWTNE